MSQRNNQKGSAGTTIIIIIIALVIIGGIWYWSKGKTPATQPATNSAAAVNAGDTQSVEASLNSVDTSVSADVDAMNAAAKGH